MKPTSMIKIIVFLLLGCLFGGSMILYSNSRGHVRSGLTEYGDSGTLSGDEQNRHYEKQFSANDNGTLIVNADAGTVLIESWDKKEVSIIVDIDGSDSRVEKYRVEFKQEGDKIIVTGKIKDNSFFKWHVGNIDARYKIFTPQKFSADIKTSGGNVGIKNLTGKFDANTSGGNIRIENIEGASYVSTSGGDIEANDIIGNLEAETSGGSVRSENIKGNFKGHTSGGDVVVSRIDGQVKAGTSGGSIKIELSGENKGIDVGTSGGDIDIYLGKNVTADIDAETTGGNVDCDLPVTVRGKVKESELHGKINGGGNPIKAETSGGSIRISVLK
ncbi:MAG: DUF4097 family beta strand repeat-containing protein [Bacteroidota bacterium]|nr:DUF4097 family beta strand repeat-containing protein [Bacteroidota bacterium]